MIKKFTRKISRFLILPLLGLIYLFVHPVDRAFAYHYIEQNCANHGAWLHDRIFENPKAVDIAFIGSSRSIHGVMDKLIEDSLPQKKVANLSYCWLGRNLTYTIMKDVLKAKKPELFILEIREDEDRYSHKMFPYLAEEEDILFPALWFNRDILTDMYSAIETRLEYHRQGLLGTRPSSYPVNLNPYGYGSSNMQADETVLEAKKENRIERAKRTPKGLQRNFYMKYPRNYLAKIARLATANNIQLCFLFIPEYGSPHEVPLELATYEQYGEVWIPPIEIYKNKSHWMDDGHLNDRGAKALSLWLIQQF